MATDPRKRQQKLERRAAKRKEKKHHLIKEQLAGLGERLTAAASPHLHTWVTEDLWTHGLGWVLLSRALPDGSVAVAVFLVDRYCLGVKNALAEIVGRSSYESKFVRKMRSEFESRDISPAAARKLVEGAVAYARALGFPPHADYHKAKLLFGDVDASACTEEFEFGKDGKPFFVSGPNDTPARCQQIMNTLARTRGQGEFHYLMQVGNPGQPLPADLLPGPAQAGSADQNAGLLKFSPAEDDEDRASGEA